MKKLLIIVLFGLSGCAYSIADIDVTKTEPVCARGCTTNYSSCVSSALVMPTLVACKEAYAACIQTCPLK